MASPFDRRTANHTPGSHEGAPCPSCPPPGLALLRTEDGDILIQERRRRPRVPSPPIEAAPRVTASAPSAASSTAMMGLGGIIILLVLVGSYTTKYDGAIGHVGGALAVPAVGYLALQVFLARAALRLFDDVRRFASLADFVTSRAFRYLPAVIPAVLLGFVVVRYVPMPGFSASAHALPMNLLMMADMVGTPEIDAAHWRLKIEIIQALLVAAAWYGPARKHLAILLTVALCVTAVSIDGEPARRHVLSLHGLLTNDGYLPLFVFGVALYHMVQDRGSRLWQAVACAAAALTFLSNTPEHGAAVVGGLVVLGVVAKGGLTILGRYRWLAHLGELAFPIYVVHYVLGFAIIHRLEQAGCPALLATLAAAAAAILVGKALNAACERPLQSRGPAMAKAAAVALTRRLAARVPAAARLCTLAMAR